ncbi:hypothetical protein IPM19_02170 [bacterium]|nr:MAG: hypothetical protein IPM19_02170 [bacterium]
MSELKENLKVQYAGATLAVQDGLYKLNQWFTGLPGWERTLLVSLIILLIPGVVALRYGSELYFTKSLNQHAVAAHPAFDAPEPIQVSSAKIVQNYNGTVSAYAEVTNRNLDLAAESLKYTFRFLNSKEEEITQSFGETYLLPDEKKWIVVSRVQSLQSISSATVEVEQPTWQKKIQLPEVALRMSEPYVYEEVNPLATAAEGSVVNNSPYNLKQVTLLLILYDKNGKILAVTTREEYTLKAFERRAYKLQWPGIYKANVDRIELQAYTNTLDPNNLSAGSAK